MSRQHTDISRRIAANICAALDDKGISAAELARRFEWNEKTVRRWRNGEVTPSTDTLSMVAGEVGVDVSWFYLDHTEKAAAA